MRRVSRKPHEWRWTGRNRRKSGWLLNRMDRAEPPEIRVVAQPASVWQVEKGAGSEVYSNGLRIDTRFEVASHARSYLAFPSRQADSRVSVRRSRSEERRVGKECRSRWS